jgi:hypothetical protein
MSAILKFKIWCGKSKKFYFFKKKPKLFLKFSMLFFFTQSNGIHLIDSTIILQRNKNLDLTEMNQTVANMMSYINETLTSQINSTLNCSFAFNSTDILIEPVESRMKMFCFFVHILDIVWYRFLWVWSGFQTDSNSDLTKNCDPDWNPDFRFKSRFKTGFQINIRFWFKANLN